MRHSPASALTRPVSAPPARTSTARRRSARYRRTRLQSLVSYTRHAAAQAECPGIPDRASVERSDLVALLSVSRGRARRSDRPILSTCGPTGQRAICSGSADDRQRHSTQEALDGHRSLQFRRPRCDGFGQRLNDIGSQPGESLFLHQWSDNASRQHHLFVA